MEDLAGWIAPAATMIAAMMTAANFGARFTGWGFVVFLVGSIAWVIVAATSGQQNLLLSNGFLSIVNLIGIWRWLVQRAAFADAAEAEVAESGSDGEKLFAVSSLEGMDVTDGEGETVGRVVDALTRCDGGRIAYLLVREGGIVGVGETIRRLDWDHVLVRGAAIETRLDRGAFARLPRAEAR